MNCHKISICFCNKKFLISKLINEISVILNHKSHLREAGVGFQYIYIYIAVVVKSFLLTILLTIFTAVYTDTSYVYAHHMYGWDPIMYSQMWTIFSFTELVIVLVLTTLFIRVFKLNDSLIGIIGSVSIVSKTVLLAFAAQLWMYYMSKYHYYKFTQLYFFFFTCMVEKVLILV